MGNHLTLIGGSGKFWILLIVAAVDRLLELLNSIYDGSLFWD